MRRLLLLSAVVVTVLALGGVAAAGNWATVHLDEPLDEAVVGVPWTVGFTVMQHDISPTNDVTPRLEARHVETAAAVEAVGRQEGAVGHFVAEVTFAQAGEWKWSIAPEPFPSSASFPALTVGSDGDASEDAVAAKGASAVHPVHIHRGTCAGGGGVAHELVPAGPGLWMASDTDVSGPVPLGVPLGSAASPVLTSVSTVDVPLSDLLVGGYSIDLDLSPERDKVPVACGDLDGGVLEPPGLAPRAIVGLREVGGSGAAGVAVLEFAGMRTMVTVYVLPDGAGEVAGALARPLYRFGYRRIDLDRPRGTGGDVWRSLTRGAHCGCVVGGAGDSPSRPYNWSPR